MTNTSQPIHTDDPVLVRRNVPHVDQYSYNLGAHSHNANRRPHGMPTPVLRIIQIFLLVVGLGGVGYYVYTLSDQFVYQKYENWAFDQQINGRTGVVFADYVREKTPFGFLVWTRKAEVAPVTPQPEVKAARPVTGALLGRVAIGRLNLAAIVREGVDDKTLSTAVGHVPSTSLPGESGNFAIAAHRDTLFRALKDIRRDDVILFQSTTGTYTYQVETTKIVTPSDVSVLGRDGGGLVEPAALQKSGRLLTMITCYPFYYVGAAPKRFIVQALQIAEQPPVQPAETKREIAANTPVPTSAKPHGAGAKRHKRRGRGTHTSR